MIVLDDKISNINKINKFNKIIIIIIPSNFELI